MRLEGKLLPIWLFFTSVSVDRLLATENKLSGRDFIPVDSR